MSDPMDKSYNAVAVEADIAKKWTAADAFHAEPDSPGTPYGVMIPPPNVTAALHLGHALNNTLQDILVRWRRMCGDNAMWMPGTDHAGITTQTVVDKRLAAEGKPALKDYKKIEAAGGDGRGQFIAKVQEWKDEYEKTITGQLKAMGCSCDWERQRFTMDETCAKAVREAFFQLFKAGLIYRGKRLVNWDPATQTALADDEVEMREVDGNFYYMRYPLVDDSRGREPARNDEATRGLPPAANEYITVATTRPETFLGDTAVAVNPKDPLRAKFIGQKVRLPIVGRVVPIIGDDYVVIPDENSADAKAKYASGFLKVTPAHDPNDYEIGRRHNLAVINVMAPDGTISDKHGWTDTGEAGFLVGKDRFEARKAIVRWFTEKGLLENVKPYRHTVGHSYRSHVPIEPYLSDQWYVKVTDDRLSGAALRAMAEEQRDGETKRPRDEVKNSDSAHCVSPSLNLSVSSGLRFFPARYAKTFQSWHENIRDWCISRQLWWGHRIPVWTSREGVTNPRQMLEVVWELKKKFPDRIAVRDFELDGPHSQGSEGQDLTPFELCVALGPNTEDLREIIESYGFVQDPDVLDTWFSSGLWPISTLGWPDESQISNPKSALNTWNPSSVLCTAREIITLWVSRMVMFNLFFREGKLPFRDVFIHAMIQDGEGQKMSKSLGNGVDPLDIIHSHGADAMRFTLAQMTTQTQDVRMPVDGVCPHCSEPFHPKTHHTSGGYVVAVPTTACPKCNKKMVTSFGAASGEAKATAEMPVARNTSSKFDNGRNFANKLWNAGRFVLGKIGDEETERPRDEVKTADSATASLRHSVSTSLSDRWILSRLTRAIGAVDTSLRDYQFNQYAQSLYDFFWRDYCDWYVEAVKPNAPGSASDRVLLGVLDASLRMLHPAMPFITEKMWEHLNAAARERSLPGLELKPGELCVKAAWPKADSSLLDEKAEQQFGLMQEVVTVIRNVRNQYGVPPKQPVTVRIKATGDAAATLRETQSLIQTLANAQVAEIGAGVQPAEQSAVSTLGQIEVYAEGLVDPDAEKKRLTKRLEELTKSAAALKGRLGNPGYADRAPAHLVQQTRDQLAEAEKEIVSVEQKLSSLN